MQVLVNFDQWLTGFEKRFLHLDTGGADSLGCIVERDCVENLIVLAKQAGIDAARSLLTHGGRKRTFQPKRFFNSLTNFPAHSRRSGRSKIALKGIDLTGSITATQDHCIWCRRFLASAIARFVGSIALPHLQAAGAHCQQSTAR